MDHEAYHFRIMQKVVEKIAASPRAHEGVLRLISDYQKVRSVTETICSPLAIEDHQIQSMPDVSPPKWHLAHTSWFFENFLLLPHLKNYRVFHPQYNFLFNSYYKTVGDHYPRSERGLLSRPTLQEVLEYRHYVDEKMGHLIQGTSDKEILFLLTLGIQHEQQHQELLLTDIKHLFFTNPLRPIYHSRDLSEVDASSIPLQWVKYPEALYSIGHQGKGFGFDNETPLHQIFLPSFKIGSRLITNGEYLSFIEDRGYQTPQLWLSDGWDIVLENHWKAPLYWERKEAEWQQFTLAGTKPIQLSEPVCHVSYYEADAFARWAGKRLPTEAEWEVVAKDVPIDGNLYESGILEPQVAHPSPRPPSTLLRTSSPSRGEGGRVVQIFGDVWEWTQSPYTPYPGFKPEQGSIGEYNGKFMCNQMVLRGGSCFTSLSHIRATYRNFFPPQARWQCTGIRLAEDVC